MNWQISLELEPGKSGCARVMLAMCRGGEGGGADNDERDCGGGYASPVKLTVMQKAGAVTGWRFSGMVRMTAHVKCVWCIGVQAEALLVAWLVVGSWRWRLVSCMG